MKLCYGKKKKKKDLSLEKPRTTIHTVKCDDNRRPQVNWPVTRPGKKPERTE
ncbi:hypothetical protein GDO81_004166 [Engystomops pustulosus]|uniref:Uncharacterized protein n=1 Tax=Engystomops pustulosus TaxID=76066 RepID=A0AAV6ZSY9_ENGPU|nr:hypothetical protein GDO81_004166 [Engystomops pustulosus]